MNCDAKLRPMRPVNETEVRCEQVGEHKGVHRGALRDYAHPGSVTVIQWLDNDRRTFYGEFVACSASCILPINHRGEHVQ